MVWGLERLKLIINWEAVKLLKQSCKKSAFRPSPIVTELNQLICCYVTCRKSGDKSDKNNSCTKNSTTSPSSFVHVFGKLYILMLYCMLRYCPCDLWGVTHSHQKENKYGVDDLAVVFCWISELMIHVLSSNSVLTLLYLLFFFFDTGSLSLLCTLNQIAETFVFHRLFMFEKGSDEVRNWTGPDPNRNQENM